LSTNNLDLSDGAIAHSAVPSPNDSAAVDAHATLTLGGWMDSLPVGSLHRFVVAVIGIGLFFDMYEIFLVGSIGTALQGEYGIDRHSTDFKLLLASAFIGMFFGSLCLGSMADRIGRRKAFLFNLIWYSGFSLLGAFW
jgi:putative MFS transporter